MLIFIEVNNNSGGFFVVIKLKRNVLVYDEID